MHSEKFKLDFRTKMLMSLCLSYTLILGNIQTKFSIVAAAYSLLPYVFLLLNREKKAAVKGLVEVIRGVKGGFRLKKRPDAISLFDVIKIMEDTICINQCLNEEENCNLKATDYCPVRRFYLSLQEQIESELKHMTFEMLRKSGGRIEYFNSS